MSINEILNVTKEKTMLFGSKTKEYGGIAINRTKEFGKNAYTKVRSPEFKQEAKDIVEKVSNGAKNVWGMFVKKIDEITSKKEP